MEKVKGLRVLGSIILLLVYMPIVLLPSPVILDLTNLISAKDALFILQFLLILSLFGCISWHLKNMLENMDTSFNTTMLSLLVFYFILLNLFPFYIFYYLVGINIFCWQYSMPSPVLVSPQKEFLAWAVVLLIPVIQMLIYYKEKNIKEGPNWFCSLVPSLFFCFFFIFLSMVVGNTFPRFFHDKFEKNPIYVCYKFFSLFVASTCFLANILIQVLMQKAEKPRSVPRGN